MLNQAKYSKSYETEQETEQYSHIDLKGLSFNRTKDGVALAQYEIKPLDNDRFYAFGIYKDGKLIDRFYKQSNAKRCVVELLCM